MDSSVRDEYAENANENEIDSDDDDSDNEFEIKYNLDLIASFRCVHINSKLRLMISWI